MGGDGDGGVVSERGGDGAKGRVPGRGRAGCRLESLRTRKPPGGARPGLAAPEWRWRGSTEGSLDSQGAVPGTRWSLVSGFSLLLGPPLLDKSCRQTL